MPIAGLVAQRKGYDISANYKEGADGKIPQMNPHNIILMMIKIIIPRGEMGQNNKKRKNAPKAVQFANSHLVTNAFSQFLVKAKEGFNHPIPLSSEQHGLFWVAHRGCRKKKVYPYWNGKRV